MNQQLGRAVAQEKTYIKMEPIGVSQPGGFVMQLPRWIFRQRNNLPKNILMICVPATTERDLILVLHGNATTQLLLKMRFILLPFLVLIACSC